MRVWQISSDAKTQSFTHRTAPGLGHGLLAQVVAGVFRTLRISASLWEAGYWWTIHLEPNPITFEQEHGFETERQAYNERQLTWVRTKKKTSRGELGGYSDLFVPVLVRGEVAAILVVGPFAPERPTSASILERWRQLSGRQGHPSDPEFALYLSSVLSNLVLEGDQARTFEELLGCFARLIAGEGPADELANRADALRVLLEPVHLVDRMWEAVQVMVDDRLPRAWTSVHRAYQLGRLGLPRIADHVLVGLGVSRTLDSDPVDEAVRRDAFQRRAVDLAWTIGGAIAGRVGDHGVVFLSAATGGAERKCQKLRDLADRAALLARREFGLSLHFGASIAPGAVPLSRSYQAALAAAESALVAGEKIRFAEPGAKRSPHSLGHLRKELIRGLEERPGLLGARFERYLEAVATQSGYQVDLARGHLEAGFERAAETLVESGALEQKGLDTLLDTLTRAATGARTLSDLLAAYRRAAADLADALQHPAAARQDRSLRLALEHIHQHYTEPLRLAQVARLSGFAPKYFSRLFSERENKPFELYVLGLRLERAKHLLSSTDLDIGRVAKLAGFASAQYFCRVFRRDLGRTPRQYRRLREYPAARTRRHSTTKK